MPWWVWAIALLGLFALGAGWWFYSTGALEAQNVGAVQGGLLADPAPGKVYQLPLGQSVRVIGHPNPANGSSPAVQTDSSGATLPGSIVGGVFVPFL